MKLARVMIVALALCMLAASASYGAVIVYRTGTLNEIAVNAQTGLVGEIGLVPLITGGSVQAGEIVNVTYSYPISSITDMVVVAAGYTINMADAATTFPVEKCDGGTNVCVTVTSNVVAVKFINAVNNISAASTFVSVTGTRINVYPSGTVNQRVSATITSTKGSVSVTDPDVDVAVMREPIGLEVYDWASDITTKGDGSASVTFRVYEIYPNGFETRTNSNTQVRFSYTVPAGLTLDDVAVDNGTATAAESTNGTGYILVNLVGQDENQNEDFYVTMYFSPSTTVATTPTLDPVTATVYLTPVKTTDLTVLSGSTGRLRYGVRNSVGSPASQRISVYSLESELLSPFNVVMAAVPGFAGYETGLAIQNASPVLDVANLGVINVTFYAANGTVTTYSTSPTSKPGTGLDSYGRLPAGATWSFLLSQLLQAAGITGDWKGMIDFQCDFTGATGISYIADPFFATQAQGYQMIDVHQWDNLTWMDYYYEDVIDNVWDAAYYWWGY